MYIYCCMYIDPQKKQWTPACRSCWSGNSYTHKTCQSCTSGPNGFWVLDSITALDPLRAEIYSQNLNFDGFFDRFFLEELPTSRKFKSNPSRLNTDCKPSNTYFSEDLSTLPKFNSNTLSTDSKPSSTPKHKRISFYKDQTNKSLIETLPIQNDLANLGILLSTLLSMVDCSNSYVFQSKL